MCVSAVLHLSVVAIVSPLSNLSTRRVSRGPARVRACTSARRRKVEGGSGATALAFARNPAHHSTAGVGPPYSRALLPGSHSTVSAPSPYAPVFRPCVSLSYGAAYRCGTQRQG